MTDRPATDPSAAAGAPPSDASGLRGPLAALTGQLAQLPLPAAGDTPDRLAALAALASRDLSLARLAEAHADAVAILAEAGRRPVPDGRYGVWAARTAEQLVTATVDGDGWRLVGTKPWCSGVGAVTHALLTAESDRGPLLFELAVTGPGVTVVDRPWQTSALGDTGTVTLGLDLRLPDHARLGGPGWYLDRPGFWHGAVGVAACWAGGLQGVAERATSWWRSGPHAAAHRAAVDARAWEVAALLDAAGRELDRAPDDVAAGHRTALRLRHLVDVAVDDAIRHVRRGCGPAPLAHDPAAGQLAALELYVRQCHAERDLESLAGLLEGGAS